MRRAAMALLAFAACRPQPVKTADMRPLPEPASVLEAVRAKTGTRKNLRALGRVTYFGEKGRVRLKAVLLAQRPGAFRFETISPFEQPIDVMASDGQRLWLLSENRLREGPATPENIARLLPLAMKPSEVVDTLLGGVPTSERFTPESLEWSEDGDRWLLSLSTDTEETSRLTIDPTSKQVERMTLEDQGGVRVVVSFEDFRSAGPGKGELPEKIRIQMPRRDLDVRIKLKEAEVDVALAPGLFRISPPPGVEPEPLDSPPVALP